jgi:hypothetical protein
VDPVRLALLVCAAGQAGDDPDTLFSRARQAEEAGQYELALSSCAELLAARPDHGKAPVCQRRMDALARRRDTDGSFAGWASLQEVRAAFRTLEPAERQARVQQVWSSPASSPTTRAEAAAWLARAALDSGSPSEALRYTEDWLSLREQLPQEGPLTTQLGQLRAMAQAELGQAAQAAELQDLVAVPVEPTAARPTPVEQILTRRREQALAALSSAALALFAAGALLPAGRSLWRARLVPLGLVPIAVATAGAFVLGELWEPGAGQAAPWMGLGYAVVHLLSVGALRAAEGRWLLSALVRLGAALATVSVAYLALWGTGTLMWVGA